MYQWEIVSHCEGGVRVGQSKVCLTHTEREDAAEKSLESRVRGRERVEEGRTQPKSMADTGNH